MSNAELPAAQGVPPVKFDDLGKSQVRDKIENMVWDDDGGGVAAGPARVLDNGPQ